MPTTKPIKAFISYKWEDEAHNQWVQKFATDLRRAGINAVLDRWEVRFGDSFTDYMTSKIAEAEVVFFVMTTKSVEAVESPKGKGGAVKFEIQMATARLAAGDNMRLIPIYREGHKTADYLRDHRYVDFRDDSQYEQKLKELVDDLRGNVRVPPVSHSGRAPRKRSPDQAIVSVSISREALAKIDARAAELALPRSAYLKLLAQQDLTREMPVSFSKSGNSLDAQPRDLTAEVYDFLLTAIPAMQEHESAKQNPEDKPSSPPMREIPEDVAETNLWRFFLLEKDEILRHKWLRSQELGYELSLSRTIEEWLQKHRSLWAKCHPVED